MSISELLKYSLTVQSHIKKVYWYRYYHQMQTFLYIFVVISILYGVGTGYLMMSNGYIIERRS